MQKKIMLALLLAAFVAGGAFAQINLSFGGGALFDLSGNNGYKWTSDKKDNYSGTRNTSIGAFVFFDATYVEADAYFAYGSFSPVMTSAGKTVTIDDTLELLGYKGGSMKTNGMQFGFSVLGKYPIPMNGFTLFPLVGFDYNVVLSITTSAKDNDGKEIGKPEKDPKAGENSQFGFLAGIGGDIPLSGGPMFLRLEGLLHMRLASKAAKDGVTKTKSLLTGDDLDTLKTTMGFGPQIKIAIGYKL
jgi:hypothetical protein